MDDKMNDLVEKLGGRIIDIDPSEITTFNPFEIPGDPQMRHAAHPPITIKDVLDANGELKSFEILSNEIGLTMEMYIKAVEFLSVLRESGVSIKTLLNDLR
ncbi:hypothetical protein [Paenibacillus sp. FSL K6-2859]|uniref:hypothetical protein n=1 Tax=Paenibacillus sp. FSL K6-2859 TaxID=2921482 RepID=UPI0030F6E09C